jgi:hypothetical protein
MRRFGYSMAACLDKGGYATEKDRNNYMKRWFYCKFPTAAV